MITHGNGPSDHHLGSDIFVHNWTASAVKREEFVGDSMSLC
jgi:hypothetical protein